jgi:hypothetical protein
MEQTKLEDGIDTTGNGDVGDGRCTVGVGPENECPLTTTLYTNKCSREEK